MRTRQLIGAAVAVALLTSGYLVVTAFNRMRDESFVRDALLMGAEVIQSKLRESQGELTQQEMEQVFTNHHDASVSPIWFDAARRPVDAWGTHFRITYDSSHPAAWVLCESAGPDRVFGTEDDLSYRTEK
jgi:hypothetical protein